MMQNLKPTPDDLIQAVRFSDIDTVRDLLDRGADIDGRNRQGSTPLMWAANAGQMETVQLLLHRGADINGANRNGETALIWAVAGNRIDMVRLLIAKGANPEQKDVLRRTALSHAARFNRAALVRIFQEETDYLVAAEKEGGRQNIVMAHQQRLKERASKGPKLRPAP